MGVKSALQSFRRHSPKQLRKPYLS